jgi:hypothetical protein
VSKTDPTGMPFKMHVLWFAVSMLAALVVVGFGSGLVACDDCGWNPFRYLYAGAIHAVMTTLAGGFVYPAQERAINAWPYIVPVGIVMYGAALLLVARGRRKPQGGANEPSSAADR